MKSSKFVAYDVASGELTVMKHFRIDERQLGILRKMWSHRPTRDWIEFRGDDEPSEADEKALFGLRKAGLIRRDMDAWHETYVLTKFASGVLDGVLEAIDAKGGADV